MDSESISKVVAQIRERIRLFLDNTQEDLVLVPNKSEEVTKWIEEIQDLDKQFEIERKATVAVLGTTGAGKSTLLNALIGQELLPESFSGICTASITRISRVAKPGFRATVEFQDWSELEKEVDLKSREILAIQQNVAEVAEKQEIENDFKSEEDTQFRKRLESIYPIDQVKTFFSTGNQSCLKASNRVRNEVHQKIKRFDVLTLKELSNKLDNYLKSTNSCDENQVPWGIVKEVKIEGNFIEIPFDCEIVDLPGLNDPNPTREALTYKTIAKADFIFIVHNIKRYETKDIDSALSTEGFIDNLYRNSDKNALTFIATHCDLIQMGREDREKYKEDKFQFRKDEIIKHKEKRMPDYLQRKAAEIFSNSDEVNLRQRKLFEEAKVFCLAPKLTLETSLGFESKTNESVFFTNEMNEFRKYLNELVKESGVVASINRLGRKINEKALNIKNLFFYEKVAKEELTQQNSSDREKLRLLKMHLEEKLILAYASAKDSLKQISETLLENTKMRPNDAISVKNRYVRYAESFQWNTLLKTTLRNGRWFSPGRNEWIDLRTEIIDSIQDPVRDQMQLFYHQQLPSILENYQAMTVEILQDAIVKIDEIRSVSKMSKSLQDVIERAPNDLEERFRNIVGNLGIRYQNSFDSLIDEIRSDVINRLEPSMEEASRQSGTGMRRRMLNILESGAEPVIFESANKSHANLAMRLEIDSQEIKDEMKFAEIALIESLSSFFLTTQTGIEEVKPEEIASLSNAYQRSEEFRTDVENCLSMISGEKILSSQKVLFLDGSSLSTIDYTKPRKTSLKLLLEIADKARTHFGEYDVFILVDPNYKSFLSFDEKQKFMDLVKSERITEIKGSGTSRNETYADRWILRMAQNNKAVVISNDNYQDLRKEFPFLKFKNKLFGYRSLPNGTWEFFDKKM